MLGYLSCLGTFGTPKGSRIGIQLARPGLVDRICRARNLGKRYLRFQAARVLMMMQSNGQTREMDDHPEEDGSKMGFEGSKKLGAGEENLLEHFREDIPLVNDIILVGRLGQDPMFRMVKDYPLSRFSLAVKILPREQIPGVTTEDTDWFDCEVWGTQAEVAQRILKKGMRVGVFGKLGVNRYTARDKRVVDQIVVVVDSFEILQSRRETSEDLPSEYQSKSITENRPARSGAIRRQIYRSRYGDDKDEEEKEKLPELEDIPF